MSSSLAEKLSINIINALLYGYTYNLRVNFSNWWNRIKGRLPSIKLGRNYQATERGRGSFHVVAIPPLILPI